MRWEHLRLLDPPAGRTLPLPGAVERTFPTPQFRGLTFYEVHARSVLNRVPEASRVPFRWTVNPYRGCSHACVYCFARKTHTYLDLDAGADFDRRIVVKVNAPEVLRRELARPAWRGEHVAMGTNVDCYQRAEGRYRLMRGILGALRDAANPFSILTKGTLVLRDLDLLTSAAKVTDVSANVSVGFVDAAMWRAVEPGTPAPTRRLQVCRTLREHGIRCGVLMAPILPMLTDSDEQLEETVAAIAAAGATHVSPIVLHLRPGAREWFFGWLAANHPRLVADYEQLYRGHAYVTGEVAEAITGRVRRLARRYGLAPAAAAPPHPSEPAVPATAPAPAARPVQEALL